MKQTKQRFPAPTSKIIYIYITHEKVEKSKKNLEVDVMCHLMKKTIQRFLAPISKISMFSTSLGLEFMV